MKDVSWASIAEPVTRELLGEPNRTYSGKRELRWGRKGSLVVHVDRGTWHDFEAGEGGGVLDLIQRETNTDKAGAIAWLQERGYLPDPNSPYTAHRPRSPSRNPPGGRPNSDSPSPVRTDTRANESKRATVRLAEVCEGWEQIPADQAHPVRRWAALRDLWQPDTPFPPGLAWLPASAPWFRGLHEGAGAILFKLAPLAAWQANYPRAPAPAAVQLISINAEGKPALDRPEADEGLSKRTYGIASGHVLLIGDGNVLHVCEGLADGLRIRRYEGGSVAIVCGTSGVLQCHTWTGFEHYRRVCLWPDGDKGGRDAAREAGQELANREISVSIMHLPDGVDPAEAPLKRRSASQNTASRSEHQERHRPSVGVTGDIDGDNDVAIAAAFTDLTAQYTKRTVL